MTTRPAAALLLPLLVVELELVPFEEVVAVVTGA